MALPQRNKIRKKTDAGRTTTFKKARHAARNGALAVPYPLILVQQGRGAIGAAASNGARSAARSAGAPAASSGSHSAARSAGASAASSGSLSSARSAGASAASSGSHSAARSAGASAASSGSHSAARSAGAPAASSGSHTSARSAGASAASSGARSAARSAGASAASSGSHSAARSAGASAASSGARSAARSAGASAGTVNSSRGIRRGSFPLTEGASPLPRGNEASFYSTGIISRKSNPAAFARIIIHNRRLQPIQAAVAVVQWPSSDNSKTVTHSLISVPAKHSEYITADIAGATGDYEVRIAVSDKKNVLINVFNMDDRLEPIDAMTFRDKD